MQRLSPVGFSRRARRGVAFIYFSLLAIPSFFFGAGLACDFTRIIIANRQMSNASQAAALAGAEQFQKDTNGLNKQAAINAAVDTFCRAMSDGGVRYSTPSGSSTPCIGVSMRTAPITVTVTNASGGPTGPLTLVTVTANYKINGLTFTSWFTGSHSMQPKPIVHTARVCIPNDPTGPTHGMCAGPLG